MNRIIQKNGHFKRTIFCMLVTLLSWNAFSQGVNIKGKVSDTNGIPLIGVNVLEDGTLNGTVTDINGDFALVVSDGNARLKLTYIGYQTLLMEIAGQSQLNIVM